MRRLATLSLGAWLAACSASAEDGTSAAGAGGGSSGTEGAGTGGSSGTGFEATTGAGGGAPVEAEVFAHSDGTLYRLDPVTKAVTVVGAFQGCSSIFDIALDKASNLYGSSNGGLYAIDKNTAACTLIASGDFPNSLSFVPEGVFGPTETLVGYEGDEYVRIDTSTGQITSVGYLGGSLGSSGDVVSVIDGPSFLTAIDLGLGSSCPTDCLLEIDPATGALVRNWGPLGYQEVYGIAFWGGSVYGFTASGQLFEVTFPNGTLQVTAVATPGTSFFGAGSTTSAPTAPE